MNNPFRIWDEELIPKLCRFHLIESWYSSWTVFDWIIGKEVINHPSLDEFQAFPIHLIYRMHKLYKESKKHRLDFYDPPNLYDVVDEPLISMWKEYKYYVPWQSKANQIEILRKEGCKCQV